MYVIIRVTATINGGLLQIIIDLQTTFKTDLQHVLHGWYQVLSAKFSDAVVSGVFQQHKLYTFEGAVVMASVWQQSLPSEFMRRAIPLEGNPLIHRLPATSKDPVGTDIRDIPKVSLLYVAGGVAAGLHLCDESERASKKV